MVALMTAGLLAMPRVAPAGAEDDAERAEYARLARQCRELLQTSVIEFYLPACVDTEHGGYFEVLREGRFANGADKFLVLQARQLWFFSTLAAEGVRREEALPAARQGFEFLQRAFLDRTNGGYFAKVSPEGRPTDTRKHAYLNAFALYGLAAWYRASGDEAALRAARDLFRVLDTRMRDMTNGGYHEFFHADWRPVTEAREPGYVGAIGVKTYNTHLHLMEAFAELYREWPEATLGTRLDELIAINTCTVRDPAHRSNVDAWHPDWRVVNTPRNLRASYGHDVECAWLVLDAWRARGRSPALLRSWAEDLSDTSVRLGYDTQHGGLFYAGPLGRPADDLRKEWWVQAEALVGFLELHRLTGRRDYFEHFRQTLEFVTRHQVATEGGWWATRRADGSPDGNTSRTSPWQGAYHNGRALLRSAQLLEELAAGR